ncbi:hypothetical protein BG841_11485 [Marinobacter sp. X15-166B]|nr:hypothetical protein BG841_11485 [Marinobacter sp. X15-166B]
MHAQIAADRHQRDDYQHYDYPGRFKSDTSGAPFARARLDALRNDAREATGQSNRPDFVPGSKFSLQEHDQPELNQPWLLTTVVHAGTQPQALEEEGGADPTTYSNAFRAIPASLIWRPRPGRRPRMDGPQVAIVTGPEGEEIHCDAYGRVKVRFPWDRGLPPGAGQPGHTADRSSAWLRVSQGWAGDGYGFMALPRVGHEVLVSFFDGDPDQPIITGGTYHATNLPPYPLPAHKTRTVLKTKTHKGVGSNELRFEDEAGEEQVFVHAQRDLDLLIGHNCTETIDNDSHLTVGKDAFCQVNGDEHLTVNGEQRQAVRGECSHRIGGTFHQQTAGATLSEAGSEVHHQAGTKVVLDAGSELTLAGGGSFISLDASGVCLSGPVVKINSGGAPARGSGQAAALPRLPDGLPDDLPG